MSKIKGIAFDKDGTLIDFEASWGGGVRTLLRSIFPDQIKHQEVLAEAAGFNLNTGKFAGGSVFVNGTTQDVLDAWLELYPDLDEQDVLQKSEGAFTDLEPIPICDLVSLLTNLQDQGYLLAVITNAAEAPTLVQLEKLGCLHLFDKVIGCDSGFTPKPAGDTILGFCAEFGLQPDQVAMVGDSTHDLNAGRNAAVGLNVGVLSGPAVREQIEDLTDIILDDITSLPAVLS
jgi:phosphoglycolate phosphatase